MMRKTPSENTTPHTLRITPDEATALRARIQNKSLADEDVTTILGLISFCLWLQEKLFSAKLSIKRLKKIFGFKREKNTEKKGKKKEGDQNGADDATSEEQAPSTESNTSENDAANGDGAKNEADVKLPSKPRFDPEKNHGHYSVKEYTGCSDVFVPFEEEALKAGFCPDCAQHNTQSRIYPEAPMILVCLEGSPLVSGKRYELQRARCAVCAKRYTANMPSISAASSSKIYTTSCTTSIAINHYYAGLPFKRLEMLQAAQGVPLPDATQYDLMASFYERIILKVFTALEKVSSEGDGFYFDDTPGRILEMMQDQKSTHVTALVSMYESNRIYLFYTNNQVAGRQMEALLSARKSKKSFFTMSDASPSNFSDSVSESLLARWILCLCLIHGRRKFFDLIGDADEDSQFVVSQISKVYDNERNSRALNHTDEERLAYHQKHSQPLMDSMRIWLNNLFLYKKVEPNSELGKAITYVLSRWYWLTQFLRVPGVPLDNNLCERAIKILIRYRKASLFYKTLYGAGVGDAMMSVIHTAAQAGVNIFAYLNTLQENEAAVNQSAAQWLPWNYQETLKQLNGSFTEDIQLCG
jgi:hypothetical protein